MTYNPDHDRNYWRAADSRRMIEAARDSGHELAIALGERLEDLEDADEELDEAHTELHELRQRCDALRAEVEELHAALTADSGNA